MNGYLLSIMGTVIFSSVVTAILPEGKTAGLIKAIARMVCVLAIVAPVITFFSVGSFSLASDKNSQTIFSQSVIDGDREFIQYYSEMRISHAQEALSKELLEKYGVETVVGLEWELVEEEALKKYSIERIKITRILVNTEGKASEEMKGEMSEYLTKNYCSEVLIE